MEIKVKNLKTFLAVSTLAIGLTTLSACKSKTVIKEEASKAKKEEVSKAEKPHWEYSGKYGPANWAKLSEDFKTCATGKQQSPFDIKADKKASLPALGLNYKPVPMKVINNGHTIQVDQAGGGQLVVDGKSYDLLQFHFHTHSEYSIDGKFYPLEVHLVHATKAGELAVVGVMFEEGAANSELAKIWANMPSDKGENMPDGLSVNAVNLLPDNKQYYRFMGSLTTPPCSEGVNWHVMSTPITASAEQIAAFKALYPMNARPLQAKNDRIVVLGD